MNITKDNGTLDKKVSLRHVALKRVPLPVVMETHGGWGDIYASVYHQVEQGVVFESNSQKATFLASQRPQWAVYEADCISSLRLGAGSHLPINFLDVDPYGDPWPVLSAFLQSARPRVSELVIVVNDGLRQSVKMGGAWQSPCLEMVVEKWGNQLWDHYLPACEWLMSDLASESGYQMSYFDGYYCGSDIHSMNITHYVAVLRDVNVA